MGKIVDFSSNFSIYPQFIHIFEKIVQTGCLGRWLWYNERMSNTKTASKSILAGLLASENLSVVHDPAAQTASFDLKNRVLTLPVWQDMSNSLYDMLVGHEVAHALHTPCDAWKNEIDTLAKMHSLPYATVQQYVNVVEDARIERLMKTQFPGLRRDFLDAYVDLMNRDLFDLNGRKISDLSLIDRLNLEFKVGIHAGETIPFDPTEIRWIERIQKAQSFDDVLDIVNDLLASIIDEKEEQEEAPEGNETEAESGEGSDEGTPESDSDGAGDESDEDRNEGSGAAGDEESDQSDSSGSSSDSDDASEEGAGGDTENGKYVPAAATEQAFSKVSDSLREDDGEEWTHGEVELAPVDLDRNIIGYRTVHRMLSAHWAARVDAGKNQSDIDCAAFVARSKPTVNVLVKQFEMKKSADAHKRVQISKSGVLDTVKMMNYKWSEDVFRKTATVRDGKNHGLVMFLDWSGSMCDQIEETMEQLITLVLFCKKVNIPFEVYAFSSNAPICFGHTNETNLDHYFTLLNLFSSRMNKQEFAAAIPNCFALARSQTYGNKGIPTCDRNFGLGGTPLNEAILAAIQIVPKFKDENNVQIVNTVFLTDGCGNGLHVPRQGSVKIKGDRIGVRTNGKNATNLLTQMLKDRTGAKVLNFFLANWGPTKFTRSAYYYFENEDDLAAGEATWKSDNYAISTRDRQGWDEQYLIRTVKVENSNAMAEVSDSDSTTKKKNAFLKSMKGRATSRVVLNRFIDLIA